MSKPLAIVAGAGPGLGQTVVSSFGQNGYTTIGLNRTLPNAAASTLALDLTSQSQTMTRLRELFCTHGVPELVVHNTAKLVISPFENTSIEEFEETWRAMVLSAVNLAKVVMPAMAKAGGGTFIISGATASLRGGKNFSAFASAKAGLRALAQSLAREYGPKGVHVIHVILDGIVDTETSRAMHGLDASRMLKPADLASIYLALAKQPKSTWTHELDLRPMGEPF
ncbi:oxidoreductase, short-chain dehydrogenase/reductase family protein [Roseobacter sp. SK209-2-6]|uniref:SDR family NAD(P)-dependent oxidoreductase n=1 Tax=Roseobacter sp. SK209-2-6 TaxID=388739 RepID=UPI0000F3C55B|nr:SDR family NAD(P)-dependent oxidoreductase [Roseobacter sp. SK209-2-6]EBA18626.1 oxidoreductase, short-chain dehydrogenase/reductase family protein [Roseobacter sp. SK209-2-6]